MSAGLSRRWKISVLKGLALPTLFCGRDFDLDGDAWRVLLLKECCFCKSCGIYTHHIRRSDPSLYCVNIGCFDDINICDYLATAINDVVNMSLAANDADY